MTADFVDRVGTFVRTRGAERIVEMNETTKRDVERVLRQTLDAASQEVNDQGVSMTPSLPELANRMTEAVGSMTAWDEARAETIARTETMFAYNDAALASFREYGVTQVEAIDGDNDEECAARDGQVFDLETALGIVDHPNGTLDWLPVIGQAEGEPSTEVAPAADGQTLTYLEASDRLDAAGYYGSDLSGLDEASIFQVVTEAERLAAQFPDVFENMKVSIEMSRRIDPRAIAATGNSTYNGVNGTAGLMRGESRIFLNTTRWAEPEKLAAGLREDAATGWTAWNGEGSPASYVLNHEFGHILDASLGNISGKISSGAAGMTKYGASGVDEFFGEVVAQVLQGAHFTSGPASEVEKLVMRYLR